MRNEDGNGKGQPSPCGTSFTGEAAGLSLCNDSVRLLLVAVISFDFDSSLWSSLRIDKAYFIHCHESSKRSCRYPVTQVVPLPGDTASTSQQDPAKAGSSWGTEGGEASGFCQCHQPEAPPLHMEEQSQVVKTPKPPWRCGAAAPRAVAGDPNCWARCGEGEGDIS